MNKYYSKNPCYASIDIYSNSLPLREIKAPVFQVDIPPVGAMRYKTSSSIPKLSSDGTSDKDTLKKHCGNYISYNDFGCK